MPDSATDSSSSPASLLPERLAQINELWRILLVVSAVILVATSFFGLDILPATLLGTAIIGFNFYWTRHIVVKIFQAATQVKQRMVFLYLIKFGISIGILFVALIQFQMSALGLLIGLSNIVIAVMLQALKQTLFP